MYNVEFASVEKKIFLIEHQLTDLSFVEDFKNLIDFKVSNLNSYKTNVLGKMTEWDTFTSNETFQKIITSNQDILKCFIKDKALYCDDAWGNKLENNDEVIPHNHNKSAIAGIIYLTEGGPGTYFPEFKKIIKEKIGKIVFFDGLALHSVPKSNLNKARYTLSFNLKIFLDANYHDNNQKQFQK